MHLLQVADLTVQLEQLDDRIVSVFQIRLCHCVHDGLLSFTGRLLSCELRKAEEDGRALDLGRMVGLASKDVVQDDYSDAHGQLTDATTARQATSSAKHGRRGSFMDTAFDRNYPIHGEKIKTAGKVRLINRRQSAGCYRPVKIM